MFKGNKKERSPEKEGKILYRCLNVEGAPPPRLSSWGGQAPPLPPPPCSRVFAWDQECSRNIFLLYNIFEGGADLPPPASFSSLCEKWHELTALKLSTFSLSVIEGIGSKSRAHTRGAHGPVPPPFELGDPARRNRGPFDAAEGRLKWASN